MVHYLYLLPMVNLLFDKKVYESLATYSVLVVTNKCANGGTSSLTSGTSLVITGTPFHIVTNKCTFGDK